ncbi:LuxR C-terminal-related transcriptional regulator [Aquibaculum arenosum]|uniref:LuxR C-terminal-related transcriptional regulator n=1 Tax=Aquibaculum arenosum TaxID=3032591 RepID=A0ABT5YLK9_9PROT|nr:LuxR C-terminal-related transcriptional regulator [Fodinicurvata sp. CAU 1616]MDF2095833.1 LuxR C-terminal-related transcriptional regulator [Fodinicurvata sp. CAU 1616]
MPEPATGPFGAAGGVILVGSDSFQREVLEAMVQPTRMAVLGRYDFPAVIATPLPVPVGRQIGVLITSGRGLLRLLRQRRRTFPPALRIIVISPLEELSTVLYRLEREQLLQSLAGWIEPARLREVGADVLLDAVQGVTSLPPPGVQLLIDRQRHGAALAELEEEERRLLALLMTGASNAEIADRLGMPLGRIRNMVRSLLAKLGCRSRTAAAILAYRYLGPEGGEEEGSGEDSEEGPSET